MGWISSRKPKPFWDRLGLSENDGLKVEGSRRGRLAWVPTRAEHVFCHGLGICSWCLVGQEGMDLYSSPDGCP